MNREHASPEPNAYSETWFDVFLANPHGERTAREIGFLKRHLPQPRYSSVLDICCGYGRHAGPLADAGYTVLGIDRATDVVKRAAALHDQMQLRFCVFDMMMLNELPGEFDAVICMWQSFGYFDSATNMQVLRQIADRLRTGGRLVLDIYNREFFESRQGTRILQQHGFNIATSQSMRGDRLTVELNYVEKQEHDIFDWQVFTPETITALAETSDLELLLACTDFDENTRPSAARPRMQLVFEKS